MSKTDTRHGEWEFVGLQAGDGPLVWTWRHPENGAYAADVHGWIPTACGLPSRARDRRQVLCSWHVAGVPVIRIEWSDALPAVLERWQPLPVYN